MKKIFYIFLLLMMVLPGFAQSPVFFNYQASVRDDNGSPLKDQLVSIKISILEGSEGGFTVYLEHHQLISSQNGIINFQIGKGQNVLGDLMELNWGEKSYWMEVEMDKAGGNEYVFMNSSQLVSVPYALYANKSTVSDSASFSFNSQYAEMALVAQHSSFADTADFVFHVDDADSDPENELQTISINEYTLSISGGNSVELPSGAGTQDDDPTNEIQDLSADKTDNIVSLNISSGGQGTSFDITDGDSDSTNELQTLALSDQTLSITDGNELNLSSFISPWQPSILWDPHGIFYWGNVYMDTVDVNYRILVGDNAPYGTEILEKDLIMTDALFGKNLHLTPGMATFQNETYMSILEHSKLQLLERTSPTDYSKRLTLMPDSLNMYNDLGEKTVLLGTDDNQGFGLFNLYDGEGNRNIRLGSNFLPDFGQLPHTGGIQLFSNDSLTMRLESLDDGGFMQFYNKDRVPKLYIGTDGPDGGILNINNAAGDLKIKLSINEDGEGNILTRGTLNVQDENGILSASIDQFGVNIWNEQGLLASGVGKSQGGSNGGGVIFTNDENEYANFIAGGNFLDDNLTGGFAGIFDNFGVIKAGLKVDFQSVGSFFGNEYSMNNPTGQQRGLWNTHDGHDAGSFYLFGPNNELNISMDYNETNYNRGAIYVYNETGEPKVGLFIRESTGMGELFADVKHFRVDHPEEEDKEIWYASLEGPEAAAYVRGTAKLENGEADVHFPEHFKFVSNTESMTVQVTPLFWDTYGIAVVQKTKEGFSVKELKGGQGNYEFDWEVKCVRKGFEDYKIINEKVQKKNPQQKPMKDKDSIRNKH